MVFRLGALLVLAASALHAGEPLRTGVAFDHLSNTLPHHSYVGGWEHFVGGGVAVFDCNSDDLPEIAIAGGTDKVQLFQNRGEMAFQPAPLPPITGATGLYPIDMDGDAILDLFVLRVGQNIALKGDGACGFTTLDMGIDWPDGWSTAFSAIWMPGDDHPTLIVGNYVDRSNPDGPFEACDDNVILRPSDDGAWQANALTPGFCPLSALAYFNADGTPLLRLSNDRHYYVRDGYEQLYDLSARRFLGAEDGFPKVSLWGMGIAQRDVTGDGHADVMLTSMGDQLLQLGAADGSFTAAPYEIGTYAQRPHVGDDGRPSTGWHAQFGDIDNDGLNDLFIAKGNVDQMPGMAMQDPNNLLRQTSDGSFEEISAMVGVATTDRSRGAALADLDNDGRLDLVVVNRRAPLELYRNATAPSGNWLKIDLRQPQGNRFGIGAQVKVGRQAQQRTIGGGHAGGQMVPLHFGLGQQARVKVQVVWPDGFVTDLGIVDSNQTLTVNR
ncbi:CRTAC1 family protein [Nereida sp. MMG025]|uniref:CRTAC1 family protein n=1 Tax=Nereida sp. MMG025 TaxID=2909981 RepID=UPI001F21A45A|nr:CRTAC1 family protein [Nereida sp. MMG025]MCF6444038.1 CRTAC1 family protein [Nereida sp. MMG025]